MNLIGRFASHILRRISIPLLILMLCPASGRAQEEKVSNADILQALTKLDGKIDRLETEMKGEIRRLETEMKGEIKRLETEINGRIDRLKTEINGRIDRLETEMKGEIKRLDGRIDGISKIVDMVFGLVVVTFGAIGVGVGYLISISRKMGAIEALLSGRIGEGESPRGSEGVKALEGRVRRLEELVSRGDKA